MIPYHYNNVVKINNIENKNALEAYKAKKQNNNNIELNDNEYCSSIKKINPNKGSPNQFESRLRKRLKLYYDKVKKGGLIIGDDYNEEGVRTAIEKFSQM